jgi:hypothetical protein
MTCDSKINLYILTIDMSFVIKKYIIHPGMSTTQNNTISHPKTHTILTLLVHIVELLI